MSEHLGGCMIDGDAYTFMPDIWQELLELYQVKSVLDVGCGAGKNLEWFGNKGLEIQGVEGWPEAVAACKVPVLQHDYTVGPLTLDRRYDLCICTEFVEHVEQCYEDNWFKTLLAADQILMCHGLPGQAGYHHVNCQTSEYWVKRFADYGYVKHDELTEKFRDTGRDAPWGRNTLMLFVKQKAETPMKKTVLSHFYNEEYLLPWWLEHHKQIFDHGIMIDYHSTDRSVEIIKEICPTWEIITSRNMDFQADNVDYEVMDIERNLSGWRMCINTPEFLIGDYSIMTNTPNQQFVVPQTIFVDTDRSVVPTYDKPLWEQKNMGFSYKEDFKFRRGRSVHNLPVQYPVPGKHYESYTTDKLVMFYFGWCPLTEEQFKRKLQIQTQIPLHDRQRNWGFHNITNRETLEYKIEDELIPKSHSLQEEIDYYVAKHKDTANIL